MWTIADDHWTAYKKSGTMKLVDQAAKYFKK